MEDANQMIYKMFADILKADMQMHYERAKKDPEKYRDSTIFGGGPRYKFYDCSVKYKGYKLRFCYSSNKNIGNRYLSWTEAGKGKMWKRVGILSHATKKEAIERSLWKLKQMRKPAAERVFKPTL